MLIKTGYFSSRSLFLNKQNPCKNWILIVLSEKELWLCMYSDKKKFSLSHQNHMVSSNIHFLTTPAYKTAR